jgi:hypothetical protein
LENGDTIHIRSFVKCLGKLADVAGGPIGSWLSWSFGVEETLDDLIERGKTQVPEKDWSVTLPIIRSITSILLAGCAWLKQRVVVSTSGHIERHRRKQLALEHRAPLQTDVKIIELRRSEPSSHPATAGSREQVDWTCRWIVNGHFRNQYHPSTGKRELKYIGAHVKGPGDKPLKVPTHTVYAVSR